MLNVFGYIVTGNYAENFAMFAGVLMSLLTFYPFYYFARKNILTSNYLVCFFLIMLPITVFSFISNREFLLINRGTNNLVNNVSYDFVNLIPFVFLIRKRRLLALISMLILMFFIIQGAKRGAIITGFVGLAIFVIYQLRTINKKNRKRGYILSFIGIVFLMYFSYSFYLNNEFLIYRMEDMFESGGSNRDIIYAAIWEGWYDSKNPIVHLLGFGFAGSKLLSGGMHAHNDWLELLSNFGVLGVSIYIVLFYSSYRIIMNSESGDVGKRLLMLCVVSMWFIITLFSMGYTGINGYLRAIILAYLVGSKNKSITS
ncbi:MAG: hypothetical protein PHE29_11480 [Tissierellia bacterium]|nr:hypothetical protein [Tissierellia bacterium]